jgi:hypothetical protein
VKWDYGLQSVIINDSGAISSQFNRLKSQKIVIRWADSNNAKRKSKTIQQKSAADMKHKHADATTQLLGVINMSSYIKTALIYKHNPSREELHADAESKG